MCNLINSSSSSSSSAPKHQMYFLNNMLNVRKWSSPRAQRPDTGIMFLLDGSIQIPKNSMQVKSGPLAIDKHYQTVIDKHKNDDYFHNQAIP